MIKINLLPVRVSKKREAGKQWLAGFAFVAFGALGGNYYWLSGIYSQTDKVKAEIAHDEKENQNLEKIIGEVKDIKIEKDAIKEKLATLGKLKSGRMGPVRVLDELAGILTIVPHVWLTSWDEQGGQVIIAGAGTTHEEIANFMRKMRESKYFDGVTLKSDRTVKDNQVDFTITCNVKYAV